MSTIMTSSGTTPESIVDVHDLSNSHHHSSPYACHPSSPRSSLLSPPSSPNSSFSSLPSSVFSLSSPSSPPPSPLSLAEGAGQLQQLPGLEGEWDAAHIARVLNGDHIGASAMSFGSHISQSFVLPSLSLSDFEREHESEFEDATIRRRPRRTVTNIRAPEDVNAGVDVTQNARVASQLLGEGPIYSNLLVVGARGSGAIGVAEDLVSYGNHAMTLTTRDRDRRSRRRGERRALVKVEDGSGVFKGMKIITVGNDGRVKGYVLEFDVYENDEDYEPDIDDLVTSILDAIHAPIVADASHVPFSSTFTALILVLNSASPSPYEAAIHTRLERYIPILGVSLPGYPATPSTLLSSVTSPSSSVTVSASKIDIASFSTTGSLEALAPYQLRQSLFHSQALSHLHELAHQKRLASSYVPSISSSIPKRARPIHRRSTNATITGPPPPMSLAQLASANPPSAISSSNSTGGRSSPNLFSPIPSADKSTVSQPYRCILQDPLHLPSLLFLSFSLLKETAKAVGFRLRFIQRLGIAEERSGMDEKRVGVQVGTSFIAVTAFLGGVGVGWVMAEMNRSS